MYGSSLRLVTRTPREVRIAASDAAAMPFPSEETTPPVTNTNLVIGWPVQEIGILPDAREPSKRATRKRLACAGELCRLQRACARCVRVLRGGQTGSDPSTRGIAPDEFEHRVDRRRLERASHERAQRHHHLRRLEAVARRGGLDRRAERLPLPRQRGEFTVELVQRASSRIRDLGGEQAGI